MPCLLFKTLLFLPWLLGRGTSLCSSHLSLMSLICAPGRPPPPPLLQCQKCMTAPQHSTWSCDRLGSPGSHAQPLMHTWTCLSNRRSQDQDQLPGPWHVLLPGARFSNNVSSTASHGDLGDCPCSLPWLCLPDSHSDYRVSRSPGCFPQVTEGRTDPLSWSREQPPVVGLLHAGSVSSKPCWRHRCATPGVLTRFCWQWPLSDHTLPLCP